MSIFTSNPQPISDETLMNLGMEPIVSLLDGSTMWTKKITVMIWVMIRIRINMEVLHIIRKIIRVLMASSRAPARYLSPVDVR